MKVSMLSCIVQPDGERKWYRTKKVEPYTMPSHIGYAVEYYSLSDEYVNTIPAFTIYGVAVEEGYDLSEFGPLTLPRSPL